MDMSKTANGYSAGLVHHLPPLHPGRYLFTVRVEEGIPALAGVEQRLTLRYLIDFDVLGPFMGVAWAVMAFVGAGVVAGFARGAACWKREAATRKTPLARPLRAGRRTLKRV